MSTLVFHYFNGYVSSKSLQPESLQPWWYCTSLQGECWKPEPLNNKGPTHKYVYVLQNPLSLAFNYQTQYPTSSIYHCRLTLTSSLIFIYCHGPVHFSFKLHLPLVWFALSLAEWAAADSSSTTYQNLIFYFSFALLPKWGCLIWSSG